MLIMLDDFTSKKEEITLKAKSTENIKNNNLSFRI